MIEILFPAAFIPLIILLIWIRNIEEYKKQSWSSIVLMFAWGSIFATGFALFLNTYFSSLISSFLILSVIFAPIIEETSKALGLRLIKKNIMELEDGLIYGAAAGFGFAATENLIYGTRFWNEGIIVIISLLYLRTIGTSLLHATSTAVSGYGYANKIIKKHSIIKVIPYLLLSIIIHSIFNLFAYSAQTIHQITGVVTSVMFAFLLFLWMHKKIKYLDKNNNKNADLS